MSLVVLLFFLFYSLSLVSNTEEEEKYVSDSGVQSCVAVVCGPSGVGKGTLLKRTKAFLPDTFGVAVSHTTRAPRQGEIEGVHYNFTTKEEFESGIKNGQFVEYARVNDNYYGTSIQAIDDVAKKNLICILEIDVQGAKTIKKSGKLNANYLFITTDGGLETLRKRLVGRNTESDQQIQKRLATAEKEFAFLEANPSFFGRVISNDDLEESVQKMVLQFREWYPWLSIDNIPDGNGGGDDEKLMSM